MNIIYKITDPITGKKYLGSKCNYKGLGTYFGSSAHPEMKEIRLTRPETLIFEVIEKNIPKNKLKEREDYYQRLNKVVEDNTWWNLKYVSNWDNFMLNKSHKKESKKKISKAHINKKITPDVRIKISNTLKDKFKKVGKRYWSNKGLNNLKETARKNFTGISPSQETRDKISKTKKEQKVTYTQEQKDKISNKIKNLYKLGEIKNGKAIIIQKLNDNMDVIFEYSSISKIAKELNIMRPTFMRNAFKGKYMNYYWRIKQD